MSGIWARLRAPSSGLWSVVSLTFPPLRRERALHCRTAGGERVTLHTGATGTVTMSCGSSHYPQIKETYQSFMINLDKLSSTF